jgi:hypothetical protein
MSMAVDKFSYIKLLGWVYYYIVEVYRTDLYKLFPITTYRYTAIRDLVVLEK